MNQRALGTAIAFPLSAQAATRKNAVNRKLRTQAPGRDQSIPPDGPRTVQSNAARRQLFLHYTGISIAVMIAISLQVGCSVKRFTVNTVGDLLASGDSVYERDDDLILVGDALPFSLKLVESLLSQSPQHYGLLLTASRGFVLYSYAYVQFEADRKANDDLDLALELRRRARRLYLRALDYALRALELTHSGFATRLGEDPQQAVHEILPEEAARVVPVLYWSAAALGLAVSVSRHDAALLARLPEVDAMLARALELDEAWNGGTLHEFRVTLAAAGRVHANVDVIRRHYQRALQLSRGGRASLFVAYAEAASIPTQNREEFSELLDKALSIDIDDDPEHRLINSLAQRRARWLKGRIDELFL